MATVKRISGLLDFVFRVQMCAGAIWINLSEPCTSPEEEKVGVVLHHGVGLAGQVTQSGQVKS